jgi:hypothetical protein
MPGAVPGLVGMLLGTDNGCNNSRCFTCSTLDLPKEWKIHNVFHVSLLRRYVFDPTHVLPDLPQAVLEGEILAEFERILQVDLQHLRNRSFKRFLIQ